MGAPLQTGSVCCPCAHVEPCVWTAGTCEPAHRLGHSRCLSAYPCCVSCAAPSGHSCRLQAQSCFTGMFAGQQSSGSCPSSDNCAAVMHCTAWICPSAPHQHGNAAPLNCSVHAALNSHAGVRQRLSQVCISADCHPATLAHRCSTCETVPHRQEPSEGQPGWTGDSGQGSSSSWGWPSGPKLWAARAWMSALHLESASPWHCSPIIRFRQRSHD